MKSQPNIFICLLIVLIAAPLDSAAASWMAMGMKSHSSADMMDAGEHQAHRHAMPAEGEPSTHHDADNCDEHCMNCSSHCFSSVAIATSALAFDADNQRLLNFNSRALHRASALYRPPIAA